MGQPYLIPHSFFLRAMPLLCSGQEGPVLRTRRRRQAAAAAGGAAAGNALLLNAIWQVLESESRLGCGRWEAQATRRSRSAVVLPQARCQGGIMQLIGLHSTRNARSRACGSFAT